MEYVPPSVSAIYLVLGGGVKVLLFEFVEGTVEGEATSRIVVELNCGPLIADVFM